MKKKIIIIVSIILLLNLTLVSLITSIGYDHMHILGNTLPEIAYQKAGIIKANSNTVFFEQEEEINKVFKDECEKKNNKLHLIKQTDIKKKFMKIIAMTKTFNILIIKN